MSYRRFFSAALAVLLVATTVYATFDNRTAQQALDRYEQQVERAEREYAEAMERATRQYRTELERAQRGAMQSSNTEEYNQIQKELDRLDTIPGYSGPERLRRFLAVIADRRFAVETPAAGVITFKADGTFLHSHRSWRGRTGQWSAINEHEVKIQTFDNREWRMLFNEDRTFAILTLERDRGHTTAQIREQ